MNELQAVETTNEPVLIETYWNVNMMYATTDAPAIIVLIETYWNVNEISGG